MEEAGGGGCGGGGVGGGGVGSGGGESGGGGGRRGGALFVSIRNPVNTNNVGTCSCRLKIFLKEGVRRLSIIPESKKE